MHDDLVKFQKAMRDKSKAGNGPNIAERLASQEQGSKSG